MNTERFDFDLFVIGAGSGGVRAARLAAGSYGLKVAVAEDRFYGGTCVNLGCVPKKLLVYGAHYGQDFQDAAAYGWRFERTPAFEWAKLRDNKTREVNWLQGRYRSLLLDAGVALIDGRARLIDAHRVQVGGQVYSADRILVATGGRPQVPDFPGAEHVVNSDAVFSLAEFPRRVLVVGGGYIAVEFAGIFNGLGATTSLAYRGEPFLRGFDREVRDFVAREIARRGVSLKFNCVIDRVERTDDGVLLAHSSAGEQIAADLILYATGRRANTDGLGLEQIGVTTGDRGQIVVDPYFQTSVPSIYALGDVIGGPELTPVALAQATALVRHLYGGEREPLQLGLIPTAVFCQPNIATVGPTEELARQRGGAIRVYRGSFRPLKHSMTGSGERSLVKLIVDDTSDRVIAAHMVGDDAGEIIQGLAVAIRAGATKRHFDQTLGIHPTAAEEFVTLRSPG